MLYMLNWAQLNNICDNSDWIGSKCRLSNKSLYTGRRKFLFSSLFVLIYKLFIWCGGYWRLLGKSIYFTDYLIRLRNDSNWLVFFFLKTVLGLWMVKQKTKPSTVFSEERMKIGYLCEKQPTRTFQIDAI